MCFSKSSVGLQEAPARVPLQALDGSATCQLPSSPSLGEKGVFEKNLEAMLEDPAFASSVGGRKETHTSPGVIGFKGRPGTHSDCGICTGPECTRLGPSPGPSDKQLWTMSGLGCSRELSPPRRPCTILLSTLPSHTAGVLPPRQSQRSGQAAGFPSDSL